MSHNIPRTQTAAVVVSPDAPILVKDDYPVKQPGELAPGECLVKLHCTGVCHTDLHARKSDWPFAHKLPLIGGHEGVGQVVAIGAYTNDSPVKIGDRVGIKWLADSCLQCEQCRKGLEQSCAKAKLSGYTVDGTFSQYVVSYVNHVTPIPENLSSQEAASFLCAGVTVYRALKYSRTQPGDWIVLPGAGGGLGHLAIQYAVHAFGLRVVASIPQLYRRLDTGAEKRELCLELGAEKWVDFRETKDLVKDIKNAAGGDGPHAALVSAANSSAYEQAIDYLRPGGSLLVVGLPGQAQIGASIFWTVVKSINIIGSYVGNRQDAREALDIASRGKIKCHFALKPLSALSEIYEGLEKGTVVGRVVLNIDLE
ncbi:GroES-like protein [Russula earlei]|uniref:GroES-like protein n=1 Tax=Russula earlei TaxID=71964 RepID=A0ACC0TSU6_9AGAM|nr:GroES-like protein [Russula earlei]